MKSIVLGMALVGALVALPLTASATMTDAQATAAVQGMLADDRSSTEIIKTLMDDGRNLQDATVLSVATAAGDAKLDLARVGICLADDVAQAEDVGRACVDVCTPATGDMIENLIDGYVAGMCEPGVEPPSIYGAANTPSGGSVSPST